MQVDPSISSIPIPDSTNNGQIDSNEKEDKTDLVQLLGLRKEDWAMNFFKQKKDRKEEILSPSKCKQFDNTQYFGFVKAWWFDKAKQREEIKQP